MFITILKEAATLAALGLFLSFIWVMVDFFNNQSIVVF